MKKFRTYLLIFTMTVCMMTSCIVHNDAPVPTGSKAVNTESAAIADTEIESTSDPEESITAAEDIAQAEVNNETSDNVSTESTVFSDTETSIPPETYTEAPNPTESEVEKLSVKKDGSYTTPEDVAEYIHTFGTLPNNFITKTEAKALGWESSKGNLWDVAPGKSIGGDYFGNYEGLLPTEKGRKYTECDVNYEGGYRGSERIIFSNDGLIFYTNDHYESFTQLY